MTGRNTQQIEIGKVNADAQKLQMGLAKLVLTVVELLRQILEKQAQRRIEQNTLTNEEKERLGLAFMQIKQTMMEVATKFELKPEELNLNLGSIIPSENQSLRQTSLADIVDKLLEKGTVIGGNVTISVADIDLITLNLLATISSVRPKKSNAEEEYHND
jgi:hypothetical protein